MAAKFTADDGRIDIKSLSLKELQEAMAGMGKERFRALQVYKWLWQKGVTSFDEMTNISKATRAALAERFYISALKTHAVHESVDGTRKFVWECEDGAHIESVLIPDGDRLTLCMSTQVGCAMACTFCLTGDMGLVRQLKPSEIAAQPFQVGLTLPEGTRITNLVLMGMGEPLHNLKSVVTALEIALDEDALNFSHRKITVSTVGMVHKLDDIAEALPVNLAISLNATTDEQRDQVMPINRRFNIEALLEKCRTVKLPPGKRITFEYVMMGGFNDSMDDARRLARLLRGIKAKVNLIPYNTNPERGIVRPTDERVKEFQDYLVRRGISTSVRITRGMDISAACGQLGKPGERRGPGRDEDAVHDA
jgi:23S rRNA (adenine2503-C2)-methyltransferase